jgi:ligand-binding sensor domain-containing protein
VWVTYDGWTAGLSRFSGGGGGKPWTTYTEEHGLPSNAVTSVAVTADGALWVGTEAGTVSRFDGRTWTTWTVQEVGDR